MVELMLAIAIGLIVVGMAMGGVPGMIKTARADDALATAASGLRSAREAAIGNRRNVQLSFGSNSMTLTRIEYCPSTCTTGVSGNYASFPGCTSTCAAKTTALKTVTLDGYSQFTSPVTNGISVDTGDTLGNSATNGLNLGSLLPAMFTTDGSFVNSSGDVLNGTLFFGVPANPLSMRAISIFGPTGATRLWKWNGRAWVEG